MPNYVHIADSRALVLCVMLLVWSGMVVREAGAQNPSAQAKVDTLAVLLKGSMHVDELKTGTRPRSLARPDTIVVDDMPPAARDQLPLLNVKNADLRDVFRTIAHEHNLNLVVDNRIDRRITIRLSDLPVIEALEFLSKRNNLIFSRTGQIFRVDLPPEAKPPPPKPLQVSVEDDLLSLDVRGANLDAVVRLIAQQSGKNILVRRGVTGTLTGMLQNVPVDQGLQTLLLNNGFGLREQDGIYHIDRVGGGVTSEQGSPAGSFWVQATDSLITLDVSQAQIADVLREIAAQVNVNLITYDIPEGQITAKADSLTLEATLDLLLKGTGITFRQEGSVYFLGKKEKSGIATTRLIRLHHIRADNILELIPQPLKDSAAIQIVKEHNGLMVTGAHETIMEMEHFVKEIDHPTPQILIEALVVDFSANDLFELGLSFGRDEAAAAAEAATGYRFNGEVSSGEEAGFRISGDGRQANNAINTFTNPLSSLFGIGRIGRLPADFYVRVHALSQEGKVNIRSRPQIATLNGHTASLSIGTTQYYILESETPYQNPNQVVVQQTQRFEKIEANVRLEITPWVSASGEITADIRPEFSTPVGDFNPEIPPTINSRVLESTVRLRDGETIILGGMVQDSERIVHHKVPILGSIPLLGRLFRSQSKEKAKSELIIFLTPHVFYGDEREAQRWQELQDELDLEGLDDRNKVQRILDHLR